MRAMIDIFKQISRPFPLCLHRAGVCRCQNELILTLMLCQRWCGAFAFAAETPDTFVRSGVKVSGLTHASKH